MATDVDALPTKPFADAFDPRDQPSANTHTASSKMADKDDADTCRICRGEGTADEPLFYPCKCSGSIKYVHQECLMEWLSHTQKKHCELCKTSFRFTKLYHPGMPNRIPTTIFVRRAAFHVVKMFLTWCRAVLVAYVWLLQLPWCMRVVWRSLFWVGDGGWSQDVFLNSADRSEVPARLLFGFAALKSAVATAEANSTQKVTLQTPFFSFSYSAANASNPESSVLTFVKQLLFGFPYPFTSITVHEANQTATNATFDPLSVRNPSLLSDVPFFEWFDSKSANRFIIDVLEGQIITLLVVVAFILVFLIREWVVQQQPVINMVALGNDAAAAAAGPANQEAEAELEDEDVDEDHDHDHDEEIVPLVLNDPPQLAADNENFAVAFDDEPQSQPQRRRLRRAASFRKFRVRVFEAIDHGGLADDIRGVLDNGSTQDIARWFSHAGFGDIEGFEEELERIKRQLQFMALIQNHGPADFAAEFPTLGNSPFDSSSSLAEPMGEASNALAPDFFESSESLQRPLMPSRDQSFIATGIRRTLEEGNDWSFENVPQERGAESSHSDQLPESWDDEVGHAPAGPSREHASDQDPDSERSSESWQQVADVTVEDNSNQVLEGGSPLDRHEAKTDHIEANPSLQERPHEAAHEALPESSRSIGVETTIEIDASSDQSDHGSEVGHAELEQPAEEAPQRRNGSPAPPLEPAAPPEAAPNTFNRIMEWIFGDVVLPVQPAEEPANDENVVVRNVADEAPFVPVAGNEQQRPANAPARDPEVAAAAAQAGIDVNDQEAIEDAEDLEGILELIGMQGPIVGLFQNVLFSAVLISATLACAVWVPYLLGKVVILVMGSPISLLIKLPLQIVAATTDLIVDMTLVVVAGLTYWGTQIISTLVGLFAKADLSSAVDNRIAAIASSTRVLAEGAMDRIGNMLLDSSMSPKTDYGRLSVNSHAALRSLQNSTSFAVRETGAVAGAIFERVSTESPFRLLWTTLAGIPNVVSVGSTTLFAQFNGLLSWIWTSKSYKITWDIDLGYSTDAAYASIERWTATDRMIAIFAGYACLAVAGAVYLKRGSPFSTSQQGQKIERIISDILQQAGGVLKVILIISIEMLAFPLYCGLLLDLAMLPLFKGATLYSRWQFAGESPWTSGFVHWFIGTCYMFHFALFVSMCRKIMRKGVLYFIRDPDDPTFHPVRDVLERSVTTQLRKIAFSALVYGALVIVCLGGVVWSLSRLTSNVLPIHWTTDAPSLEFPLDLLFYNFLTPVIIKIYKPSDNLHTVYKWWFKKCAGFLNLSNFLFGDNVEQHEGQPGRYVRAPASDQARIPKGQAVFVEVDKNNKRKDGQNEGGVHNNMELVTMVFIPTWFRLRIFAFVFTIWVFMGLSGVSVAIMPLLFGRYLFSLALPNSVEMNDIHAFSLGVYTLGSMAYSAYHAYWFFSTLNRPAISPMSTLHTIASTTSRVGLLVLRFTYVWASLIFLIPFLFAIVIELYFLMPLHAYLGPPEPHVVHIIQDWTLGFLYSRLAMRLLFANRQSRPARAFNAVIHDGYLYPNARIATRCFLLPILALWLTAIAVPASLAWTTSRTMYYGAPEQTKNLVWRYSFPAVGLSLVAMWTGKEIVRMLNRWRLVVRDEVYLIGERLHNFGERKAPVQSRAVEEELLLRSAANTNIPGVAGPREGPAVGGM